MTITRKYLYKITTYTRVKRFVPRIKQQDAPRIKQQDAHISGKTRKQHIQLLEQQHTLTPSKQKPPKHSSKINPTTINPRSIYFGW